MEFDIRISVGMTLEEARDSLLEDSLKLQRGEYYIVNHLGVLNWEQFYALFSPAGLIQVESFVKSHNGICEESLCEHQPLDFTNLSTHIKVSDLKEFDAAEYIKSAEDVVLYLKLALDDNDPAALADALEVISRSEGLSRLTESKNPK